ncbi:MAG: hypothetical protein E7628_07730 [Ruminococcaceae bacterium]|nr:hypothetical protein [Oscillospiraceae bacterium]
MAYCYNCGAQIPGGDKMKLCERCKRILLPFIKFMDASTSSAVKRLVSNERNLRNAGVTDSGMEYLLRLCELHDQKRIREREEREAMKVAGAALQHQVPVQQVYEQIEEPVQEAPTFEETEPIREEPLSYCEKPYGKGLTFVQVLLGLVGIGLIAWFVLGILLLETYAVGSVIGAVGAFAMIYVTGVVKKLHHDLSELKKRFR